MFRKQNGQLNKKGGEKTLTLPYQLSKKLINHHLLERINNLRPSNGEGRAIYLSYIKLIKIVLVLLVTISGDKQASTKIMCQLVFICLSGSFQNN